MHSEQAVARDFAILQMLAYGVIVSPVMYALLPPVGTMLSWFVFVGGTVMAGAATVALHRGVSASLSGSLGRATGLRGGGATTSHFPMSPVQSLIVRERWDEAVAQLQAAGRVHSGETGAFIFQQLGDLFSFRLQRHEDAVRSYRKARDFWATVAGVAGGEGVVYCTRRLIDLYADALNNPVAAEREAARLRA